MPCVYLARVVEAVAPEFAGAVQVHKVVIKTREGARRFRELAAELGRPPPVPSLFADGALLFSSIPGPEELREALGGLVEGTEGAGRPGPGPGSGPCAS
ncbi:MAG: hypothetical protein Kow0092_22320 [Deferrisomatales bacterium]